jgi:hypothetical protein
MLPCFQVQIRGVAGSGSDENLSAGQDQAGRPFVSPGHQSHQGFQDHLLFAPEAPADSRLDHPDLV